MTRPVCPILRDVRRVSQTGEDLLRALRRLRQGLLFCQECPSLQGCPLRDEFNRTVDTLVAEINREWERS